MREAGRADEAAAYGDRALAQFRPGDYRRAYVLAALGRGPEALAALDSVPSIALTRLDFHPMWDRWRNDPRFLETMVRLGCAEEYKVARATLVRMKNQGRAAP